MSADSTAPRTDAVFGRAPRAALARLTMTEARLAWRQPIGLIWGVGLPVLLLIIFGSLPAFKKTSSSLGGLTVFQVYLPVLVALTLAMLGLIALPVPLASYREQGVLRRLSTTPVPPAWLLCAQLAINLVQALAATLIIVIGGVAFGTKLPGSAAGFVLALVLAIAALFAIGLWLAAVAKTARAAGAIGTVLYFPLLFFAGLWVPRQLMPPVLRDISDFTPLGAAVQAIQASYQGGFPPAGPLLVLAVYAVISGYLAVRFFSWE